MKSRSAAALFLLATLLWAKGDLVVVEVQGGALTTPLKITDPKIQDFNIWAGPGVNGATTKDAKGFIIDWQAGVAAHLPAVLQHYEISFYEGCRIPNDWCRAEKPSLAYVVFYDYDPASQRGFVYLPGKGEPWYAMNEFPTPTRSRETLSRAHCSVVKCLRTAANGATSSPTGRISNPALAFRIC